MMIQKFLLLFVIINLSFTSCHKEELQNLDITVNGKVTDQNNNGIPNITIYIERGKTGYYAATVYEQYQTVTTNASGNYSYLVKDDTYNYEICCGVPIGSSIEGESCTKVNQSIIGGHTITNTINFKLTQ